MYVKDVASLDGHGRLAFKVQYLITIVYGCFITIMTLLYRKSLLTIARSQRSYRVTSSEATLLAFSFYKSVPFKIHGYWNKSNWLQTYYIQISLWCSQGSGVSAILGPGPWGGAPYTGKCGPGSKTKYIVSTDTFVMPGPFPLIFPCRAWGGGGTR